MEPCFDGFHESIEIYCQLPPDKLHSMTKQVTDLGVAAVLYNIGGTVIHTQSWYESLALRFLKFIANTRWGLALEQQLRRKYMHGDGVDGNSDSDKQHLKQDEL
jgi:hypothetical protein